jgi:signal transduction histidine kinase
MVESPRHHWPYFAVSVLGLALGLWGMQGLPSLSAPPAGVSAYSIRYPARVGPAVVASPSELNYIAQSRPAGSIIEIRSDAGVIRVHLEPALTKVHLAMIFLEGLIFLALSLLVLAPRVDRGPVRDLYLCALLYGVATMIHGSYFPRTQSWTNWVIPAIRIACLTVLPVLFFRMSQTFPRQRKLLERRPRLMSGLWIAAGLLTVWQVGTLFRYFSDPRPGVWEGTLLPSLLAQAFLVISVGLGCLTLYGSGRKLELSREREQTKWLLWGIAIGVAPLVFLRTLPRLWGQTVPVPPEIDRLFELCIPVAVTFAVVRYRFDVDIIIRRSVIYGTVAAALAAVYVLVGGILVPWITSRVPSYAAVLRVFALALPVLLYTPTRRWIGTWVDRSFFKTQYLYARAFAAFQEHVRAALSQQEIASLCRAFLEEQLRLERAVVIARRGEGLTAAGALASTDPDSVLDAVATCGTPRRVLAAADSTSRPDLESSDFPSTLSREGFLVALPIVADESCIGALLLGERRSEKRFTEEDLKLLHAVRAEASSALERVELVQRAAKEAFVRENAAELEGLKDYLFATLGDDLRRPLTVVRWTVETLLERMGHTSSPQHFAELQAIQAASSELDRLVKNLRDLSRPGLVGGRDLVPIDLLPLVHEAVTAVTPAAKSRNVRFELSVAPDLTPVSGYRDLLLEVVTNLLENATRYSPDGQAVEIAIDRKGNEDRLMVRDHGPGLAPDQGERIFHRLEQGRPSPYTSERGFGMGLFVAKSYLERMRGRIHAENHSEGGARFVVIMQEWREAEREASIGSR